MTTLRDKLIKIGAKVTDHSRYTFFQTAEVAVPRKLLPAILEHIPRLRSVMMIRRAPRNDYRRDTSGK